MPVAFDPLYVVYGLAALATVLAAEAAYLLLHDTSSYRTRVNRRLEVAGKEMNREKVLVQLRRERGLSDDGSLLLPVAWFNRLIIQSGVKVSFWQIVPTLITVAAVAGGGVYYLRADLVQAAVVGALAVTVLPLAALLYLRKRRRQKFSAQLPEAIDVIVRSLRAGHPVPVAISMVARELPDPVGTEFGMIADEITYGADLETAMRNMMHRVGQEDLPLFVTSVAIQVTTGGNLSQILDNLSKVIRERFKMRRKIKGLAAEGRAGAMILNITPFAVFGLVNLISPSFYGSVWDHPWTKITLGGAASWMFLGNMIMRRMVNFKF
jgi:tight adherence protein B